MVSVAIIGNEGIQSVSDMDGLRAANSPGAKMTVTVPLSKSGLKIQWFLMKGSLLLIAGQNEGRQWQMNVQRY